MRKAEELHSRALDLTTLILLLVLALYIAWQYLPTPLLATLL